MHSAETLQLAGTQCQTVSFGCFERGFVYSGMPTAQSNYPALIGNLSVVPIAIAQDTHMVRT